MLINNVGHQRATDLAEDFAMSEVRVGRRYTALSIGLHWLMVLLFVGVYASIELREFYPKGSILRASLK